MLIDRIAVRDARQSPARDCQARAARRGVGEEHGRSDEVVSNLYRTKSNTGAERGRTHLSRSKRRTARADPAGRRLGSNNRAAERGA
jgi:hypothetical protein